VIPVMHLHELQVGTLTEGLLLQRKGEDHHD
jgi:hypothetical protein